MAGLFNDNCCCESNNNCRNGSGDSWLWIILLIAIIWIFCFNNN